MEQIKKIRAVAYCRVSTDKDDQKNSFYAQKKYFEEYLERNNEFILVNVYADEGLSGTTTKKRKDFNRMINDSFYGKFDYIFTKEVSRFARNTIDTLSYIRELKNRNIGVKFLLDNIDTLKDKDSELRLTIMASLAQEESRKTSERVQWGQMRQMENGVVFGRNILGYNLKNGNLTINKDEAEIIRLIFRMYLDGMGTTKIAKELEDRGIKTKQNSNTWTHVTVTKILKNEKYCGDLVQRKTYTPDFLSHSKKYNKGEVNFIKLENHHEAIIDKNTFNKAQDEIEKRNKNKNMGHKHSNRYVFSGKIVCGQCGATFNSRHRVHKDGSKRQTWRCYNNIKYGTIKFNTQNEKVGCENREIGNDVLESLMQKIVKDIVVNKTRIKNNILEAINNSLIIPDGNLKQMNTIQNIINKEKQSKDKYINLCVEGLIGKDDLKRNMDTLDEKIVSLEKELHELENRNTRYKCKNEIISNVSQKIDKYLFGDKFSEGISSQILEKIVVNRKDDLAVFLRGVEGIFNEPNLVPRN